MRRVLLLASVLIVILAACISLERDATRAYEWQKRGQIAGDLARQYCEQASQMERGQFLYGFYGQAGRNIWMSVRCGDEPAHETPPATGPPVGPTKPAPVPVAPAPKTPRKGESK
jgi:hypothetical protein